MRWRIFYFNDLFLIWCAPQVGTLCKLHQKVKKRDVTEGGDEGAQGITDAGPEAPLAPIGEEMEAEGEGEGKREADEGGGAAGGDSVGAGFRSLRSRSYSNAGSLTSSIASASLGGSAGGATGHSSPADKPRRVRSGGTISGASGGSGLGSVSVSIHHFVNSPSTSKLTRSASSVAEAFPDDDPFDSLLSKERVDYLAEALKRVNPYYVGLADGGVAGGGEGGEVSGGTVEMDLKLATTEEVQRSRSGDGVASPGPGAGKGSETVGGRRTVWSGTDGSPKCPTFVEDDSEGTGTGNSDADAEDVPAPAPRPFKRARST